MSSPQAMGPVRRRPIPGMTAASSAPPPPQPSKEIETADTLPGSSPPVAPRPVRSTRRARSSTPPATPNGAGTERSTTGDSGARERYPAADYASTRLVNFRIPVDLHDRYRQLVRNAEEARPRLRRPSLTELVIALLEEGPQTAGEAAELIRRKRAAEHEES